MIEKNSSTKQVQQIFNNSKLGLNITIGSRLTKSNKLLMLNNQTV